MRVCLKVRVKENTETEMEKQQQFFQFSGYIQTKARAQVGVPQGWKIHNKLPHLLLPGHLQGTGWEVKQPRQEAAFLRDSHVATVGLTYTITLWASLSMCLKSFYYCYLLLILALQLQILFSKSNVLMILFPQNDLRDNSFIVLLLILFSFILFYH